jgi:hypothetical protein
LSQLGAKPVLLNGLDHAAVMRAVMATSPDAIVHQMTALAFGTQPGRRLERSLRGLGCRRLRQSLWWGWLEELVGFFPEYTKGHANIFEAFSSRLARSWTT